MATERIVILGAGHVGSHCAHALASCGIGREIVLVDVVPDKAAAQALDIADTLSFADHAADVRSGDYADCADAALVVVAIGEPRKPGRPGWICWTDRWSCWTCWWNSLGPIPSPARW